MKARGAGTLPAAPALMPARLEREARDRKDLEIINRHADRLNREAMDTLEYPG